MSFQKFKSDSYCVGGRHKSATKNIVGEITINKKTGKEVKLLAGKYVICNRKKTMIVSDNVIQAEGLGNFFKNLGKISAKAGKKNSKKRTKPPRKSSRFNSKDSYSSRNQIPKSCIINIARSNQFLPYRKRSIPT